MERMRITSTHHRKAVTHNTTPTRLATLIQLSYTAISNNRPKLKAGRQYLGHGHRKTQMQVIIVGILRLIGIRSLHPPAEEILRKGPASTIPAIELP
jgi:hypothetical protein